MRKEYYQANRERILATQKEYLARNPDKNKNYYKKNKEVLAQKQKEYWRRAGYDKKLRREYGITIADYDRMLIEQCGRCAVCNDQMRNPHVDHCHATSVVRGLLCGNCNKALGLLKDKVESFKSAVAYLEKNSG